ncbi:MAG: hypothetical protein OEW64_13675 [Gammaproteobacteria bacterium]|nr:hypothetical protein [Gammaproteobacteria bacterium]MDH5305130.1 hypothetical protein [Gammaproteobacteria bacterium]MDH5321425.1 hypothetical protein [Gammaproteobacteria bacterium]
MNRAILSVVAALALVATNSELRAETDEKANDTPARTSKVQSPVQVDYRVIGTPIVGQPLAVELQLRSTLGTEPYRVSYRVNDQTAMQLPESQAAHVSVTPSARDELSIQQVTVIPMREGRLYLNVAAEVETETGSMQTVIAIPIQVGATGPREILDNGSVTTDADGNLLRSVPAKEE